MNHHLQRMELTSFQGAELSGLDFRGGDLRECNFTNCDLTGATFTGAKGELFDELEELRDKAVCLERIQEELAQLREENRELRLEIAVLEGSEP